MNKLKVYILSRGRTFDVAVKEPLIWETHRKNTPGKLTFEVIKDDVLGFYEGDAVRFDYDGNKIFFGFIFTKSRTNNESIKVTAYDQLRYFKNKNTYTYKGIDAGTLLKLLAKDFQLKTGIVASTGYTLGSRVEDNSELFSIMDNALAITTKNTGKIYVLYDDYGKLNLRDIKQLQVDILVDSETAETFDYTSSIDENTYNQVKLSRDNKQKGTREIFIARDSENINNWGLLQYTDTLEEGENGKVKADALLALLNRKTRKLNINKVFGDIRVRGGSTIGVQLYLGDLTVRNFMICEKVKHEFRESSHKMDLKLIGGDFIA